MNKLKSKSTEDAPEFLKENFNKKELIHFSTIIRYFKKLHPDTVKIIIDIIQKKSLISLRFLEWFVIKHAQCTKLFVVLRHEETEVEATKECKYYIYTSYKATLKSYGKMLFDPFRRYNKFKLVIPGTDEIITTTIGQLNFFRWLETHNILKYILDNRDVLLEKMKISNSENSTESKSSQSIRSINSTQSAGYNIRHKPHIIPRISKIELVD